jgi:hypothetical protein
VKVDDRALDYLDSTWREDEVESLTLAMLEQRHRLFVVIAVADRTWVAREVSAHRPIDAHDKYNRVFPTHQVLGVGLLGGSGHAISWTEAGHALGMVTPDWLPSQWVLT